MRVIDSHIHLFSPEMSRDSATYASRNGEHHWGNLMAPAHGNSLQDWPSVDQLIAAMDDAGVDHAILQGWYWEHPESCERQNQFYRECVAAHPTRLSAMLSYHPELTSDPAAWLTERLAEGFKGIGEMLPGLQSISWTDTRWQPIMEVLCANRAPILFHVTEPVGRDYPGKFPTPFQEIEKFLKAYPLQPIILAHWGGLLPFHQLQPGFRNLLNQVYLDTAASPLLYSPEVFHQVPQVFPRERILFGSDYPLRLYPRHKGPAEMNRFLKEAREHLAPDHQKGILGRNAAELFAIG